MSKAQEPQSKGDSRKTRVDEHQFERAHDACGSVSLSRGSGHGWPAREQLRDPSHDSLWAGSLRPVGVRTSALPNVGSVVAPRL